MLMGTIQLYLDKTVAEEWGIYRLNETMHGFLLLSFNDRDEALVVGGKLSDILNVPFDGCPPHNLLSKGDPGTSLPKIEKPEKKKRVTGITFLCRLLLGEGKDHEEIEATLMKEYMEVGRTEKEARASARDVITAVKNSL